MIVSPLLLLKTVVEDFFTDSIIRKILENNPSPFICLFFACNFRIVQSGRVFYLVNWNFFYFVNQTFSLFRRYCTRIPGRRGSTRTWPNLMRHGSTRRNFWRIRYKLLLRFFKGHYSDTQPPSSVSVLHYRFCKVWYSLRSFLFCRSIFISGLKIIFFTVHSHLGPPSSIRRISVWLPYTFDYYSTSQYTAPILSGRLRR